MNVNLTLLHVCIMMFILQKCCSPFIITYSDQSKQICVVINIRQTIEGCRQTSKVKNHICLCTSIMCILPTFSRPPPLLQSLYSAAANLLFYNRGVISNEILRGQIKMIFKLKQFLLLHRLFLPHQPFLTAKVSTLQNPLLQL